MAYRSRLSLIPLALSSLALTAAMLTTAHAQLPVTVVLQEGDIPPTGDGTAVTDVNNPMTNANGAVGTTGTLASGDHFVWIDNTVVWLGANSMTPVLSLPTGEAHESLGFDTAGNWVYRPEADALEAVWTNNGLLVVEDSPAPGFPMGAVNNFLYKPTMTNSGAVYWIASVDTDGNNSTDARALFTSPDGTFANTSVLLQTGDLIDGVALVAFGIDTDLDVSDNGMHYIAPADRDTGGTGDDTCIIVDGGLAVQEGVTPFGADFPANFDLVAINNMGNHVISGDTNGATASDEFIAYNGVPAVMEGDTIGGVTLGTVASVQALDINNLNNVAFTWTHAGSQETLFYAEDGANIATSAVPVLARGDTVDVNGDGIADAAITDFNASSFGGKGLNLADNGLIAVNVDLDYDFDGTGEIIAIIEFEPSFCGDGVVSGGEACDDGGESMTCNANCTLAACGDGILNTTAGEDCDTAGVEAVDCDLDCTAVSCGDATTNMTAGEECDDGGESMTCDTDCTAAACGDGTTNMTAGEDCDEFAVDTATCDNDCTAVVCGDGTHNLFAGELCDDGGESATCDVDCTPVFCGDGTANMTAGETCDDAGESAACNFDCSASGCGDGILNLTAGEECDAAGESALCDTDCTIAACGDGMVNATAGEACDGAGQTADCNFDCTTAMCGDGLLNTAAGEECDAGAETGNCDSDCSYAVCGDGMVNATAGEECDGAGESADCDADCSAVVCGDGILNSAAGETCEDGNNVDGDGCSATCVVEESGCGCKVGHSNGSLGGGLLLFLLCAMGLLALRRRSTTQLV